MATLCCLSLATCNESDSSGNSIDTAQKTVFADLCTLRTPSSNEQIELLTLPTFPDAVSDGAVLIGVCGVPEDEFPTIELNGNRLQTGFPRNQTGDTLTVLITGFKTGENTITAALEG